MHLLLSSLLWWSHFGLPAHRLFFDASIQSPAMCSSSIKIFQANVVSCSANEIVLRSLNFSTAILTISRHSVIAPIPGMVMTQLGCTNSIIHTYVATCQVFANGPDNLIPNNFFDNPDMFGSQRMFVHMCVHCGEYVCWSRRCESTKERSLQASIREDAAQEKKPMKHRQ